MYKNFLYIFCLIFLYSCVKDKGNSPQVEQAIYHFYMGQSLDAQNKSYEAINELLKAEKLIENTDKFLLKGQIYWYKGQLYAKRMDYTNALKMFLKAEENYIAGDKQDPLIYTYSQLGDLYLKTNNYQKALFYYNKAIDIAVSLRNKALFSPQTEETQIQFNKYNSFILSKNSSIAQVNFEQTKSVENAIYQLDSVYKKFNNGKTYLPDIPFLSELYTIKGDTKNAETLLDTFIAWKFPNISTPDISSILQDSIFSIKDSKELSKILKIKSLIAQKRGNYREAYNYMGEYAECADYIGEVTRNESIKEAEQQFWGGLLEEENVKIKQNNKYLLIIYCLLFVVFLLVLINGYKVYRERIRKKNLQLAEFAETIDNLGRRVSNVENSKLDLLSELDVHKEKERELKELLENRFAEVRELVRTYYEYGNSKKLQKKVDDLLKLQLSGDNFEVMEQVVNAKNNDVIKKVRQMYPNIKEENIKLLNLIYAGFSAQEISVILNDTPQNIYVRKSRLKKSLQDLILQDNRMNFS